jgi:tricorn protease
MPSRRRSTTLLLLPVLTLTLAAAAGAPEPPRVAFAEPGISPDGKEIAFVSGGDIWTVPAAGGEARLLVSHPATESRPLYSPDGRSLAFVSTRTGNGDIYVLTLDTGDLRRVTYDDATEVLNGWSIDSKAVYFSSNSQDVAGMHDIFRIDIAGGTAMPVTSESYFNEFFGAVSPDGTQLAFNARGISGAQWWRHGHSHLDESEIWIRPLRANATADYRQVTMAGTKALWPMWSADGQSLFFMADRNGAENIWHVPAPARGSGTGSGGGSADTALTQDSAKAVTDFKDGRVLWPSISKDGRTIAFERNFGIWTLDTASGKSQPLTITRRGAPAGAGIEHTRLTSQFSGLALSPDGKKIAFAAHGDLFAASAKDGGEAMRVSSTPEIVESDPVWTSDSRRLVYVADQDGRSGLHLFDVAANADTTLTTGHRDYAPAIAPNGSRVAFLRDRSQVCTLPLTPGSGASAGAGIAAKAEKTEKTEKMEKVEKAEKCVAQGMVADPLASDSSLTWSPDSRWLAFIADGAKNFSNVQVVPADGSAPAKPVSFVANTNSGSLVWSPDGTFLLFDTSQRTESGQAVRVDLILRTPKFREDQFRDLFPAEPSSPSRPSPSTEVTPRTGPDDSDPSAPKDAPAKNADSKASKDSNASKASSSGADDVKDGKAAKGKTPKKTEIVFDDIRQRLSYLPIGLDINNVAVSHDGKTLLLTVANAGQENLYLYSIDELAKERPVPRQLTSTSGNKRSAQFSPDDKEVFFLDDGRVQVASVERRDAKALAVAAELDIDFSAERQTIFEQAWSLLNENFYDPAFHGANWQETRARFAPYAAGTANNADLRRLISLMIGELNASHLGISAPPDPNANTTGHLGLRFDADEYARSGRLKIATVIPLGPAAVTRGIAAGDIIVAVNGTTVTRATNLDQLLDHTIGKRVTIGIESNGQRKDVAVQPVNLTTDKGLRYRQWVEAKRAYVAKISNGRLGYVHMLDMGAASLTQLYADLDVENHTRDGVVIDIRNNNGGFVNTYAIDVFARRPYLSMAPRGRTNAPARTMLGQRALESPTVLVVNQHSLSDAEDFTEGYRALKLGPVVGEPTAGWIIYTGGERLIDGSILRLPRVRITDHEGKDMERHPRPVDVLTIRAPGEDAAGIDSQLQRAVAELLKTLPASGTQRAGR